MSDPCFVYFVQAGESGNIKIGISRNVSQRLTKMRTDAPVELQLLGVIVGDQKTERAFHSELLAHRANREWFRPSPEVLALIEREKAKGSIELFIRKKPKVGCSPLQEWRFRRGLSAQKFGDMAGISHATICRLENDVIFAGLDTLERIYRATNGEITPNDLVPFMRGKKAAVA
jgi:DNA-binding Xre family transcriptional regulator